MTTTKPELGARFVTPWGEGTVTRRSAKNVTLKVTTGGIITRSYAEVAAYPQVTDRPAPDGVVVEVAGKRRVYPWADGLAEHLAEGGVICSLHGLTEAARAAHAADPKVEAVEGWCDLDDGNDGVFYLIRATRRTGGHRILGAARLG